MPIRRCRLVAFNYGLLFVLPAILVLDVSSIVLWPCQKPDTPIDRRCHRVVYGYVCRWECVACQIATGKRLGCELRGTFADGQGMMVIEQRTREILPCQCRRMRTGLTNSTGNPLPTGNSPVISSIYDHRMMLYTSIYCTYCNIDAMVNMCDCSDTYI